MPMARKPAVKTMEVRQVSDDIGGTVKFYREDKGFGFIATEDGGKDVFIHATTLTKAGISILAEGQRVLIQVGDGVKGREARAVRLREP